MILSAFVRASTNWYIFLLNDLDAAALSKITATSLKMQQLSPAAELRYLVGQDDVIVAPGR